jgi:ABC-2 type transport system ATP-binding protein
VSWYWQALRSLLLLPPIPLGTFGAKYIHVYLCVVTLSNFSKAYDREVVLAVEHLTIGNGAYWLKGTNGTGKTTLMRCIAGLVPYQGTITAAGVDIRRDRMAYCKLVRYAEVEPQYPPFLKGADLIKFYIDCGICTTANIQRYAAIFDINRYVGHAVGTYSSGMLKKLSLVLQLAAESKVLMLDEPLATLDVASCSHLLGCIAERVHAGTTVIVTSHQDVAIPELDAQVLTISNGTLI